jgi:hypothetical protein
MATIKQQRTFVSKLWAFLLLKLDRASALYIPIMEDCVDYKYSCAFEQDDPETAKEIYRSHVARIQELVPTCLLFDVKDGWQPLCDFLGHDVPKDENGLTKPFPWLNDQKQWNDLFGTLMTKILRKRATDIALTCTTICVGFGLLVLAWLGAI